MNNRELFQFYKELYFHELESKERITAQTQVRFAFIAMGVALTACMLGFSESVHLIWLFGSGLTLTLFYYILCVLCRAFWRKKHDSFPLLIDVELYRQNSGSHSIEAGENGRIESDTLNYLQDCFAKIVSKKSRGNAESLSKMRCFYIFSPIGLVPSKSGAEEQ